jgi:hypothetical protein
MLVYLSVLGMESVLGVESVPHVVDLLVDLCTIMVTLLTSEVPCASCKAASRCANGE